MAGSSEPHSYRPVLDGGHHDEKQGLGHVSLHTSADDESRQSTDGSYEPTPQSIDRENPHRRKSRGVFQRIDRSSLHLIFLGEILAILLSIACVLALFAVLRVLEGKPYTHWQVWGASLTPNTIVSILSTASKSGLLLAVAESISQMKWIHFTRQPRRLLDLQVFDDASRGPLGCVRMLWSIRHHALVAGFGAIITILALAVDPFAQQVLAYPTDLRVMSNETAAIPTARSYDNSYYVQAGLEQQSFLPYIAQFDSALMRGIFTADIQPRYTCTSGNCKWPKYETLAFCSDCDDVSAETQMAMHNTSQDPFAKPDYAWTAPNNVTVRNDGWSPTQHLVSGYTPFSLLISVAEAWAVNYMGDRGQLANITTFVFENNQTFGDPNTGINPRPVVTQCKLRWCVNVHANSSYSGGTLKDSVTTIADLIVRVDKAGVTAKDRPHGQPTILIPAYSALQAPPPEAALDTSATPLDPNIFWLNAGLTYRLTQTIDANFNLKVNDSGAGQTYGRAFYDANGHNVSATIGDIAASLAKAIREGPNTTTVHGEALLPVVVIQVRWAWFAYSAVLAVLAAVLLVVVVMQSLRVPERVWKSSSLALLFHGLKAEPVGDETLPMGRREMEKVATGMKVELRRTDDGRLLLCG